MITSCPLGVAERERWDRAAAMPPAADSTHRTYVIARRTVLALGLLVVAAIALRDAAPLVYSLGWRLEALRPARADWGLIEAEPAALTILVQVGSSSCFDFDHVDVDEGPDEVRIEAYVRRVDGYTCTMDISFHQTTVPLSTPLADRRLVGCSQSGERSCRPVARDGAAAPSGP